ncbi:LytR/AlgR family response regulator transcription factor [Sphingobacterium griseoflavum]|uniref:DNA-binding response regulator n=1 Tax=Sphingobacterium griseoflavum TaxID=1474952 RepID=A0ABQ3I398_9SPHI|nr:LytTR family DNA-binding domain-containing protein [Sphingobacterium griseoflavum]GHE45540.1 DNA-binding response regulator [Sphingobacterium griseoflavum]
MPDQRISYLIVDDEPNNIAVLKNYLKKHTDSMHLLGTACHVDEAVALIKECQPELIFLDIQMPQKNGFDLLQELGERNFEVIFVTAYDRFGIQAIKFSALDYLLKPLNFTELENALAKAMHKVKEKKRNANLENLIQNLNNKVFDDHKIALPTGRETRYIAVSSIVRCQADNNYTEIHLHDGECIIISKTLKEYDELLSPYGFLRTHQSHLINPSYLLSLSKGQSPQIHMYGGNVVPIARQKKEYIYNALKNIIKP